MYMGVRKYMSPMKILGYDVAIIRQWLLWNQMSGDGLCNNWTKIRLHNKNTSRYV